MTTTEALQDAVERLRVANDDPCVMQGTFDKLLALLSAMVCDHDFHTVPEDEEERDSPMIRVCKKCGLQADTD